MNYGLYTAFLGMRARQRTLDAQANNIANASTTGFKSERMLYSSFESNKKSETGTQNLVAGVSTSSGIDFSTGSIQQTGRSLDVAIDGGDAFLEVQTPRGVRYTRAGNLSLDSNGQLVTKNNDLVIGNSGPISIPNNGEVSIGEDGSIAVGGNVLDNLKLVRFNNPSSALLKEGSSLFMATGAESAQPAANARVIQGSLESSNVNSITEMVAMINNNREFESLQKSATLLMNDLGRKIAGEIGRY